MDTKALREEFSKAHTEANEILTLAATEKRDLKPEEKTSNDARFARMDQIKKLFDEQQRFASLALDQGTATLPQDPAGKKEFDASEGRQFADPAKKFDLAAYKKAMNSYARIGDTRQLFTITSTTQSGAFLPKDVLQPVTVRRLQNAWRGVLDANGLKPMEMDTVASFSLPVADDTANVGQVVNEAATSGTTQDPSLTPSITLNGAIVFGSKQFWYSNTMVLAQGFDVVDYTLPMAQKRIDKIQESNWTTTAMNNGTVGVTTASPTAITYKELMTWEHSLLAAYRTDACFVVSDTLYQNLRQLVDNNNRPIMDLDPSNVFMASIHGKKVIISDYFQTFAANHTLGAFVSAGAVKILDVDNARLARYSNLPSNPDQIGFEMFQNGDAGFVYSGMSLIKSAIS